MLITTTIAITALLLLAGLLFYALYLKRDVKLHVKAFGANVSLEAKSGSGARER
jgi:hypothetical protein